MKLDFQTLSNYQSECYEFFETLDLPGRRQEIAEKILKEIQARLGFLINVGLDYYRLIECGDTLRWRGPTYSSCQPDWCWIGRGKVFLMNLYRTASTR